MILTIARHEFLKLFKTGTIWKLLALCQCVFGLIFYRYMTEFLLKNQNLLIENELSLGATEEIIHPLFAWAALFFFFITPLLATNCLTQEKKSRTLEIYLIAPLTTTKIILGKFFGVFCAQLFLLLPILLMPLLIAVEDSLDFGQFISGSFGLILLLGTNLSIALFIATLSKEPLIASFVIFITLILLSLLEWVTHFLSPAFSWVTEFALLYHCKNFLSGIINTQDILYYALVSFIFLYSSIRCLGKAPYFSQKL
ncbi:MAG TPA: ABC transporter permease subunit [Gammaproteobacteria bacterium]|nr:ABC transporter permease subunit [Gammaproteobacteria bacterium]HRA42762.1 ABC transporter permease subunit [Gammaproteobacteria bacterium]